jgi:predicted glycosyltransferase
MKIFIDILHPKHVHFFRPLVKRWLKKGHEVKIVTRDKDITHQLLDLYDMPYVCLSRQRKGPALASELLVRWFKCSVQMAGFKPDIAISIGGITTSLPSKMHGIPNIALTDTETAVTSNRIAFPFADRILTPEWFIGDFGSRHHRYRSFHEWSYLHPDEFVPDREMVKGEGIDPDEPYAVVRFVRWDAVHDRGEAGLTASDAVRLIKKLSSNMKVVLTSETEPPRELRQFAHSVRVDRMHHVMAFSRLVVGESPSMCAEAALMGVPSVLASSWAGKCGNMKILGSRYGLMKVYAKGGEAVDGAISMAKAVGSRESVQEKRDKLIKTLDDIPGVIERHIRELAGGRNV